MIDRLLTHQYMVLTDFISAQRAQALSKSLLQHHASHPLEPDSRVPHAPAVYDFLPFVRLLVEKIPQLEAVLEEKLLPTYTYARIYGHGDVLPEHVDRDACELSLTLNLEADEVWPIQLRAPDGKVVSVRQKPGDALVYLGCQLPHWRDAFAGRCCTQVFLHYVLAFGSRTHAYFDKQRSR